MFETLEGTSAMKIWVRPAEWTGAEEETPIERIDVRVTNYLGDKETIGHEVIAEHVSPEAGPCKPFITPPFCQK